MSLSHSHNSDFMTRKYGCITQLIKME